MLTVMPGCQLYAGIRSRKSDAYPALAMPNCFMFDRQTPRRAVRRAEPSAGRRMPISNAMIAITTSSSISVKPR